MAVTADAAARLVDFTQPLDVPLLDVTVEAFYTSASKDERAAAERVLRALQEHPETWTRVVPILQTSQSAKTKFFALQVRLTSRLAVSGRSQTGGGPGYCPEPCRRVFKPLARAASFPGPAYIVFLLENLLM